MNKKYPLESKIIEAIKTMVKTLPSIKTSNTPVYRAMYGFQIIEAQKKEDPKLQLETEFFIKVGDKDIKIRPNKIYNMKVSNYTEMDHQGNMEKLWQRGGKAACDRYMIDIKNEAAKRAARETKK